MKLEKLCSSLPPIQYIHRLLRGPIRSTVMEAELQIRANVLSVNK